MADPALTRVACVSSALLPRLDLRSFRVYRRGSEMDIFA
jgi:hypothetical protein